MTAKMFREIAPKHLRATFEVANLTKYACLCCTFLLLLTSLTPVFAEQDIQEKTLAVEMIPWLEESHAIEMFSALTPGPDGKIYYGTCTNAGIGAMLIAFDPKTKKQEIVADMLKVTGPTPPGTYPQSKIHSHIVFDNDGRAWFGTHSYEWYIAEEMKNQPEKYPGGHFVMFDSRTGEAEDHGIGMPHESIMSITMDPDRQKVYAITHPSCHFLIYDIETRTVTDKGIIGDYPNRSIIIVPDGRVFTTDHLGHILRYDPNTDKLEKLPALLPTAGDKLEMNAPFAMTLSADKTKIYGTAWSGGQLWEYDTDDGPYGSVKALGPAFGDDVVPGTDNDLCIAMTTGKDGNIYYAGYGSNPNPGRIARYNPTTGRREYLGQMTHNGEPIKSGAGAACTGPDGTIYVAVFDQQNTYLCYFKP